MKRFWIMSKYKYNFIYKITNLLSGKMYVGLHSTDNLDDGYFGSGVYLKNAINKHGKENFQLEIIEHTTEELIFEREIYWISKLNTLEEGYNLTKGGEGVLGFVHNEETINKNREQKIEYYKDPKNREKLSLIIKELYEKDEDYSKRVSYGVKKEIKENPTKVLDRKQKQKESMKRPDVIEKCKANGAKTWKIHSKEHLLRNHWGNQQAAKTYFVLWIDGTEEIIHNLYKFKTDYDFGGISGSIVDKGTDLSTIRYYKGKLKIMRMFDRETKPKNNLLKQKEIKTYKFIYPDGTEKITNDLRGYCEENDYLITSIRNVLNGYRNSYKGIYIEKVDSPIDNK